MMIGWVVAVDPWGWLDSRVVVAAAVGFGMVMIAVCHPWWPLELDCALGVREGGGGGEGEGKGAKLK